MVAKKKKAEKAKVEKIIETPKVEEPKVEEVIEETKVEEAIIENKIDGRKFGNETILSVEDIILNGKKIKEIKTVEGQSYRHSTDDFEKILKK